MTGGLASSACRSQVSEPNMRRHHVIGLAGEVMVSQPLTTDGALDRGKALREALVLEYLQTFGSRAVGVLRHSFDFEHVRLPPSLRGAPSSVT